MGVGWRRPFRTSTRVDPPETAAMIPPTTGEEQDRSPSPMSCSKLSFFSAGSSRGSKSTPTTPRLLSSAAAAVAGLTNPSNLRCRTKSNSPDSPGLMLQCEVDGTPGSTLAPSTVTTPTTAAAAAAAVPEAKAAPRKSPALFQRRAFSMPSSPRSPSAFGLFKHFYRSRCRICSRSLKASQEMPVFTAECSHTFHFPCIAGHVRTNGSLVCPICSAAWSQAPFLSAALRHSQQPHGDEATAKGGESENRNPNRSGSRQSIKCHGGGRDLTTESKSVAAFQKVYDDDEPLRSMAKGSNVGGGGIAGVRFNPIPEAAEEDKDGDDEDLDAEFKDGFISTPTGASKLSSSRTNGLQVNVMSQAALITAGRRHHNYVVLLKVKAPSINSSTPLLHPAHRAPIDLVTVLDVSHGMTGEKLYMLKRAMRLVISSLGPMDRLSVVAFSAVAGAKRLLPLRRMSRQGQRSARQIVERLVVGGGAVTRGGKGTSIGDALRKATKVLEDRRECNPVATIMLLSDTGQQRQQLQEDHHSPKEYINHHDQSLHSPKLEAHGGDLHPSPSPKAVNATTRFAHLEIPVGSEPPQQQHFQPALYEDTFAKCVGGLVSVVMLDVHLQLTFSSGEVSAVYLCSGGGAGLSVGGNSIRLGDMYAEEERELLVELRVPAAAAGVYHEGHYRLSVKCNYMDPATQQLVLGEEQPILLPPLVHSGSYSTATLHLRNLFVSTRAVRESRRLVDLHDYATAQHLLSSALSLLLQSTAPGGSSDQEIQLVRGLEAELADLQRRRLQLRQQQQRRQHEEYLSPSLQRLSRREASPATAADGRAGEQPLTPTSAWRAAEQLAKVAIMRKSLNRVSDLHGFENARF